MSVQDILNYIAIQGSHDASGFSADANGNIIELLKYIIANPGGLAWGQSPHPALDTLSSQMTTMPLAYAGLKADGGPVTNLASAPTALTSCTVTYDATTRRPYARNNTGAKAHWGQSGMRWSANGPTSVGDQFDLDGGNVGALLAPLSVLDCLAIEFEFAQPTATPSDNDTGFGMSAYSFSTANHFGLKNSISFYRKSAGGGWTLVTADSTPTVSESSEAADTSDGNRHIGRIEWHNKATPEARLYIDGTLKVTKTTNLPDLSDLANSPGPIGFAADTAVANDSLRLYGWVAYWKDSSA